MANDQLLFLKLAEALGQPNKNYQALQTGFQIPEAAMQGYERRSQYSDAIRKRKLQRQTLAEVLGGNAPDGTGDIPLDQADMLAKPVEAYASLLRAKREAQIKDARAQQANFLLNGSLMEYDPDKGYYPARIEGNGTPSGKPSGPLNITPRVAPTIPGGEVSKFGELETIQGQMKVARDNYDPSFTGFGDAMATRARQFTGVGATAKAANFSQAINDIKDSLLRARSGAQINEQEYARLTKLVPDQSTSDVDFQARMNRFDEALQNITSSKSAAFSKAGYRNAGQMGDGKPAATTPQNSDPLGLFK